MSEELTIIESDAIEKVTELLKAASWCKTQQMEFALVDVINKYSNPCMISKVKP